jgi:hypothetical protein
MRNSGYVSLTIAIALILLALFIILPSGAGRRAFDREMAFTGGLHNSLYQLEQAKRKWAVDNRWAWTVGIRKSAGAAPTLSDLAPYLGEWTNAIHRFIAAGIEFNITPLSDEELQSDVATFTRNISFQRGFCRFYRAGTRYGLRSGWASPQSARQFSILPFYQNNRELIAGMLFVPGIGSLLVFAISRIRRRPLRPAPHSP